MFGLYLDDTVIVQVAQEALDWIDDFYWEPYRNKKPTKFVKKYTEILTERGALKGDLLEISLRDLIEIFGETDHDLGYTILTAFKSKMILVKGCDLKTCKDDFSVGDSDPDMCSKWFGFSMESPVTVKLTEEGVNYIPRHGVKIDGNIATLHSFRSFMQNFRECFVGKGNPLAFQKDGSNGTYVMFSREAIREAIWPQGEQKIKNKKLAEQRIEQTEER